MVDLTRPIIGIENRTAQEVFDIMCGRFRAAEHALAERAGGRWQVKDYADGWIDFDTAAEALAEVEAMGGALIRPITTNLAAPKRQQDDEPRAYIIHAPEDDYYGTGPDRLQFHPLAQHDMDNGYRQTPLYGRPAPELSGNTRELIDRMAEAIRGDTTSDDTPWATLSEDRKIGWRGDAERALAVVKHYLTARRPAEQAVTEEWREIKQHLQPRIADGYTAVAISKPGYWFVKGPGPAAALKAAMEAGRQAPATSKGGER